MDDSGCGQGLCSICKDALAGAYAELGPGKVVSACAKCLESAKENFIWICMKCGGVYIRPKSLVLKRLRDLELKRAYLACEGLQIIQGIDACVECEPEAIIATLAGAKFGRAGGCH